jgi:hypothetical protein
MSIDPGMLGHTKETYTVYQADTITPIHDRVLVTDMEFGEQKTAGGIILPGDDGQASTLHHLGCMPLACPSSPGSIIPPAVFCSPNSISVTNTLS